MLAGHALFRCPVFNTALRRHRQRGEGRISHNKRGRPPVDTEHSDTPPVLRGSPEIKCENLFSDYPTYYLVRGYQHFGEAFYFHLQDGILSESEEGVYRELRSPPTRLQYVVIQKKLICDINAWNFHLKVFGVSNS
jgi:hypothetical protein